MPTGVYQHKSNANSARKLEDIAESIDLMQRRSRWCANATYKTTYVGGKKKQASSCREAIGIVVQNGEERWLCEKCFEKVCDFLQEDLRLAYKDRDLVVYE